MNSAKRRNVVISLLAAAGLILFLWLREGTIVREGELFEIRANGRVFDYANGQPIPDAWVLLGLHSSNPTIGGYGGGCSDGSAVVKTDASGEFSYRATIRKVGSGGMGFWTVVYHPDYTGELTWGPPTVPGVSTFPIDHPPDGVPLSIGMARRDIDEWEALWGIYDYSQQACVDWTYNRGHAEFNRMRFERTLALHCGSKRRDEWFPLRAVMNYLESRLTEQAMYALPDGPEPRWSDGEDSRRSYVKWQLLPNYPWELARDYRYPPRDLTTEERAKFCSFYSLPIENLVNKEFLP